MSMLIFYLTLALGVSFLCSLFEAVILSVSPAYTASLVNEKHRSGPLLQRLKSNIDDSLAAILTLNTIAHTIGSAGAGAEVLKIYGDGSVAIGSAILTLLILVLSEIIPKTLGATYWRQLAPYVAYGIKIFIYVTYPFVVSFKSLSKLLGASDVHGTNMTRDEILYAAEIGYEEGTLADEEIRIIKNLLHLRSIRVEDVMTPRTVVFAFPKERTVEHVLKDHPSIPFSRIPIYADQIDNIVGVVLRHEIVNAHAMGKRNVTLEELATPIHSISRNTSLSKAFQAFTDRQEHIFVAHDGHGGVSGIVTLEDILETLLGVEIVDEYDSVEDMRKYAAEKWAARRAKRGGGLG